METLTIRQAFDAMVCFLEDYYQRSKSDEIAAILSGLSLLWLDPSTGEKWTGDPAYWIDWMKCVQNILFPDTPENHRMLEKLVSDQTNKLGTDSWGSEWYARILSDGRQLWANVRHGEIQCGGIRQTAKPFNSKVGLSSPNNP